MKISTHWQGLDPAFRGASVALGNFDGVHRGHMAVLDAARQFPGAPLGVVTFEPHPREFFQPGAAPFRLMNAEARANRLARLGVEHLYQLPFDAAMAGMPAEDFVRDVLHGGLGIRHLVVGADFRFGKARTGNAAMLEAMGRELGFTTTVLPLLGFKDTTVSSSAIREALSEGRPRDAARMLGHLHRIDGPVIHGEKRGRELGFPTANMSVAGLHLPRLGVYAVRVHIQSGPFAGDHDGVASLGVRPMFGENSPNLETYLFDFAGDLYGTHLSVGLVEFLRPELNFESLEVLIERIAEDSAKARALLAQR